MMLHLLLSLIIVLLSGSIFCEIPDHTEDEKHFVLKGEEDFHNVFTEDCSNSNDAKAGSFCHKAGTVEKLIEDLIPGINIGLKTVYLRLFDCKKKNVKYFKDVHIKDPSSLSIFSEESGYNSSQISVFFVHGFIDRANWHLSTTLAEAFLSRGDVNVFDIDWSKLNQPPYSMAIQNLKSVGYAVAEFFHHALEKKLIKISDIHLIGHSLGAHLVGYIGRNLVKRPPVIVGLDPAGPEFATDFSAAKLTFLDADCVHYIQTNRFIFGTNYELGHANYKFNSRAVLQPGCFTPGCSHFRAVEYFAEAVKNPGTFIAVNCNSYDQFMEKKCNESRSVIGFPVDTSAKGLYFITTNGDEPYGRGEEGVKPANS